MNDFTLGILHKHIWKKEQDEKASCFICEYVDIRNPFNRILLLNFSQSIVNKVNIFFIRGAEHW